MERPSDPAIRPFQAEDVPPLAAWLADAGLRVPPQIGRQSLARRLLDDDRIRVWTATDDGAAIGFVRLDLAPDRTAELTVIVAPGCRRRGVGRVLVDHALREARRRGLRRLIAVVSHANAVGSAFFAECGFEPSGVTVPGFDHLERYMHRSDLQSPLEIVP